MSSGRAHVDALDFRILKELFAGATEAWRSDRVPLDDLARTLRVHRNTVSARVAKLERYRAFLPLSLEVEPSAFGLVGGLAFLDVPQTARTEALRDVLFAHGGVQTVLRFSDGWIVIAFARTVGSLETLAERLRARAGASRVTWEVQSQRDYPDVPQTRLSRLDVQILAAMLENSRASFHALGRSLGVASSSVKRRFDRLSRAGLCYVYPGADIDVDGMAMAYLHVRLGGDSRSAEGALSELLRALPNHFIRNAATRGHAHFFLWGESLGALESQLEEVRRIPYAELVSFRPFLGRWTNPAYRAWLIEQLRLRSSGMREPSS